jgi:hypothetical protein
VDSNWSIARNIKLLLDAWSSRIEGFGWGLNITILN